VPSGNDGQSFAPIGRWLRKRQVGRLAAAATLALDGAAVVPWALFDGASSLPLLLARATALNGRAVPAIEIGIAPDPSDHCSATFGGFRAADPEAQTWEQGEGPEQ
jgi:hypothetical protein